MIDQVLATVRALPFLLPGIVVAAVVGAVVGRRARRRRVVSGLTMGYGLLLLTLGVDPHGGFVRHPCDLTRWVPLPPTRWLETSSDALNVWVFVVLGALAARSSRPRVALAVGALLPLAIETCQTFLTRDCTSFDVVNNLVGLAVGAALVALVQHICEALHKR